MPCPGPKVKFKKKHLESASMGKEGFRLPEGGGSFMSRREGRGSPTRGGSTTKNKGYLEHKGKRGEKVRAFLSRGNEGKQRHCCCPR